ncbi:hypothetical protein ACIQRE_01895 [Streptomyces griseoluteus]|uniref:hypothetical protein n=1 Tax=Streptomyces griseoluteus TaxID=29306 RepID=UPI0037FC0026
MKKTTRTFTVHRDEDVSGVSGEGVIAEGVLFSDGWAVTHWLDQPPMNEPKTEVWHHKGVEPFGKISGHGGRTRIVWDDEAAAARQSLRADLLDAFAVPASVLSADDELSVVRERVERALRSAATRIQQEWHVGGAHAFPGAMELTGTLDAFADAVLSVAVQLQAERSRAQAAVDRARALGARWKAAPDWASHLVRVAGAELLDELGDSAAAVAPVDQPAANAEGPAMEGASDLTCICGSPVEWLEMPDDPGWIHRPDAAKSCHHARPRCPECQMPHAMVPGQRLFCESLRRHIEQAEAPAPAVQQPTEVERLRAELAALQARQSPTWRGRAERAEGLLDDVAGISVDLEYAATAVGMAEPAREVLRDTARRLREALPTPLKGV